MTDKKDSKDFNGGLFERMQEMHRTWLERLKEVRQIESDYGHKLLNAKNPSEATAVCNEWMAKRLETVASEQQAFTTAWLALVTDTIQSTSAIAANTLARGGKKIP